VTTDPQAIEVEWTSCQAHVVLEVIGEGKRTAEDRPLHCHNYLQLVLAKRLWLPSSRIWKSL
jgi:hypothetical protein